MEPFQAVADTHTLHLRLWEQQYPGLIAGFTLRTGGQSESPFQSLNLGLHVGDRHETAVANRQLLCRRLHLPFDSWTSAEQVHGNRVQQISSSLRGAGSTSMQDAIPGTDGLYTDQTDVFLTSFYADCVPLYFFDPNKRAIGLAHAGWKGTVGQIAKQMVEAFKTSFATEPKDLLVAIGPSIGGCCYEVDEPLIAQVRKASENWPTSVNPSRSGRYLLDLAELNKQILLTAGVSAEQIVRTSWCTACRTDMFFSHRKEAGKTGRMASFIGWKQEGGAS